MKEKILELLEREGDFVSGQRLCERLGVSRTAVWKSINSLREEGYEIESVTRRGYRLLQRPDLLTEDTAGRCLRETLAPEEAAKVHFYEEIDSTNEEAKRQAALGAPDGSVYVSDRQTAGKGRRGRSWSSPKGEDVFFSILLRPEIPAESASMVTLVAALAGAAAVEERCGVDCRIKWPNDLLVHEKKICGILTEMSVELNEIDSVVIGIGFNLNRTAFEEELRDKAGSLYGETGRRVHRGAFLAAYLREFWKRYRIFVRDAGFAPFVEEYNAHLINLGREVRILGKKEERTGVSEGVNERGELIVRGADGKRENVFSGEVSVRGLHGYV